MLTTHLRNLLNTDFNTVAWGRLRFYMFNKFAGDAGAADTENSDSLSVMVHIGPVSYSFLPCFLCSRAFVHTVFELTVLLFFLNLFT